MSTTQKAKTYEVDFAAWAFDQAAKIRSGKWQAVDIENVVEELESMGKQQRAELVSRLVILLMHLAKLEAQPDATRHHRSWQLSVLAQRANISDHLKDNPSLKPFIDEAMVRAWRIARLEAARECRLSPKRFAVDCPVTFKEAMTKPMDE